MEVLQYLGTISDGHEVVMTTQKYTPYVIVTGYDHDTMSWASAYGYYTNLGDMARAIAELEMGNAKNKMVKDLMEFSNAYDRICSNYDVIAKIDKNFEDAFSENYPFKQSFDEIQLNYWVLTLGHYLKGNRKIGEVEYTNGEWHKPKED